MVRLTDSPDMTLDVYHGRKTTTQQLTLAGCRKTLSQLSIYQILIPQNTPHIKELYNWDPFLFLFTFQLMISQN